MTTVYAAVSVLGGAAVLYPLTVAGIHRLVDWHDQHTDRPSPLPIRPHRADAPAITARPHFEAVDELGPWNPSQHQPMPALLAGELIGATR